MGCFAACFGSSKDRRRRCRKQQHKKHNQVQPGYQRNADQDLEPSSLPVEQSQTSEEPVIISTVVEKMEEENTRGESSPVYLRKRVTFDSNVKAYEPLSVEESAEFQNAAAPNQEIDNGNDDDQNKRPKQDQSDTSSEASSLTSSSSSYPSNHRYQNCRDSDEDEFDLDGQTDSASDNEDDGDGELDYSDDDIYDESTTRFPSAATTATKFPSAAANDDGCFPKVGIEKPGQNVRDRSGYVHPVLNPVENLTQWRAAKSKKLSPPLPSPPQLNHQPSDKENDQEPSFKVKSKRTANQEQVLAVDASLSNWLSSSSSSSSDCCTTTPNKQPTTATTSSTTPPSERSPGHWVGSASPKSFEDRPILGALTVEEIRQMSASTSPIRKSPGHSPDDKFIIGSVGSYWRSESDYSKSAKKGFSSSASSTSSFKGIPNATSKYREDKRVNWQSTPFETMLERALNGAQS